MNSSGPASRSSGKASSGLSWATGYWRRLSSRRSPPWLSITASMTSVRTWMRVALASPSEGLGVAGVASAARGAETWGTPGVAAGAGAAVTGVVAGGRRGALCSSQACQISISTMARPKNRNRRWLSMVVGVIATGMGGGRDRIVAAWVPRMAARQPAQRQPGSTPAAMLLDRLQRVMRAARVEAAMLPQPGTQQITIAADDGNQDFLHRCSTFSHSCCSATRSAAFCARPALVLATTTKSRPPSVS